MATLKLPKKVVFNELVLDEGFQFEKRLIPTEAKVWLYKQLIKTGFKAFDIGNFGSPRYLLNSADTEETYRRVGPIPDEFEVTGRAPNMRGMQRILDLRKEGLGPNWVGMGPGVVPGAGEGGKAKIVSAKERDAALLQMIEACHSAGLKFSVPAGGFSEMEVGYTLNLPELLKNIDRLFKLGVDAVGIHETGHVSGGIAPTEMYEVCSTILDKFPYPDKFRFHFHDGFGWGVPCLIAGMQAGLTHFDTCFGGLSGPASLIAGSVPSGAATIDVYPPLDFYMEDSPQGLVPTEDIVSICDAMGIDTGLSIPYVISMGMWVEQIVGHKTHSNRLRWHPWAQNFKRIIKEKQWNPPVEPD